MKPVHQKDNAILDYCAAHNIQWSFITPLAPWQGGIYERMVGLVKGSMKKTIRRKRLTQKELQTLMTDIEAVLKCRPITPLTSENTTVLRSVDFLLPHGNSSPGVFRSLENDARDLTYRDLSDIYQKLLKCWEKTTAKLDNFWTTWREEYLMMLRERYQTTYKQRFSTEKRSPRSLITSAFERFSDLVCTKLLKNQLYRPSQLKLVKRLGAPSASAGSSSKRSVEKSSQPSIASYAIFGERCTATVNYELDEGYVLTGDDVHIDSCLANVTACKASTGKCTADGRIILWDKKMLVEQCAWHRVGTYLAQVTEKRIIVDKLQASFVPLEAFDESWTQAEQCQLQSFAPMQKGILITFDDWKQQDVID
uniref:DDE-1 domain-containing protein n=1 Tax=Ascaris lumbricoides TaxID=6252 RepID=A0A0M3HU01_ASCLU